jgi:phytanoyl-CoA hydroxylase
MAINSQQQKHFYQEGYIIIRRLISGNDLSKLDQMINLLLDGDLKPTTEYEGWLPDEFYTFWEPEMKDRTELPRRNRIRLMSNMYHHHPYFKAFGGHPAIYDVISSLFQSGVQMFSDTVFNKPAHHGIEAALHQDTAFWPKLDPNAMNFWLAVDAATVENGCLHIIPATHTVDLSHHDHPTQGHILYDSEVDFTKQIPVELDPGDAIFLDSGLVHRSYPNQSDHSRRAFTAVYGAENLRHVEPWKTSALADKTPNYRFELIVPPVSA